jgi:hypothetical protein
MFMTSPFRLFEYAFLLLTLNQSTGTHIARESNTIKDNVIIVIDFVYFEVMTAVTVKITYF